MKSKWFRVALLCLAAWSVSGSSCPRAILELFQEVVYSAGADISYVEGTGYVVMIQEGNILAGMNPTYRAFDTYEDAVAYRDFIRAAAMEDLMTAGAPKHDLEDRDAQFFEQHPDLVPKGGPWGGWGDGKPIKVTGPVGDPPPIVTLEPIGSIEPVLQSPLLRRQPGATPPAL